MNILTRVHCWVLFRLAQRLNRRIEEQGDLVDRHIPAAWAEDFRTEFPILPRQNHPHPDHPSAPMPRSR